MIYQITLPLSILYKKLRIKKQSQQTFEYDINTANKRIFKSTLESIQWNQITEENDTERGFSNFLKILDDCFLASFPKKLNKNKSNLYP